MNEDFISFELAKKLKEIGFREKCLCRYKNYSKTLHINEVGPKIARKIDYSEFFKCYNSYVDSDIDAPTISQVLKWMREEKAISVEPYASASGWRVTICRAYHQDRCDAGGGTCLKEEVIGYNDGGAFEKYEETAIAGIEYCLDNLI